MKVVKRDADMKYTQCRSQKVNVKKIKIVLIVFLIVLTSLVLVSSAHSASAGLLDFHSLIGYIWPSCVPLSWIIVVLLLLGLLLVFFGMDGWMIGFLDWAAITSGCLGLYYGGSEIYVIIGGIISFLIGIFVVISEHILLILLVYPLLLFSLFIYSLYLVVLILVLIYVFNGVQPSSDPLGIMLVFIPFLMFIVVIIYSEDVKKNAKVILRVYTSIWGAISIGLAVFLWTSNSLSSVISFIIFLIAGIVLQKEYLRVEDKVNSLKDDLEL